MTTSANYAEHAYKTLVAEIPSECEPELLTLYTLLAMTLGEATTLKDVHDAWSLWRMTTRPTHPSLVPFDRLSPEIRELDRPYMNAIHRAAKITRSEAE